MQFALMELQFLHHLVQLVEPGLQVTRTSLLLEMSQILPVELLNGV